MGWDFWTCIHGIQEGLDTHECGKCQDIARDVLGLTVTARNTYIITEKYMKQNKNEAKKIKAYEKAKEEKIRQQFNS